MTDYKTLLQQKAELESQIAAIEASAKADAVAKARALIADHGLTAADVFPPAKAGAKPSTVGVAKYRNPETGATWTGRGKPPLWILGKDREQFLIAATPAT